MTTIKAAVDDLLDLELPLEEAVDRHYGPGFRQRTDGAWEDRDGLLRRMDALRAALGTMSIIVLDELGDGPRYAERHIVDLAPRDGEPVRLEVSVFAERDDEGRFVRIEETTRPVGLEEAVRH